MKMSAFDEDPFAKPPMQSNLENIDISEKSHEVFNPFDAPDKINNSNSKQTYEPPFNTFNKDKIPTFINEIDNPGSGDYNAARHKADYDIQRREQELERRAKDLERRETELKNTPHNIRQINWPPIPGWCPWGLKPCFYQDITVDIPAEFQMIVRNLYYLWLVHAALLLANMIVGILFLFGGGDSGETFGKALVYFALLIPLSYICWFRPAYKAFRNDSSMNFMIFFFVFFCQLLVIVIHAMGVGNTGSCGFILGISTVNKGGVLMTLVGIVMIIMGLGFAMCGFANFYLLVTLWGLYGHKLYRGTGASMAKTQTEFSTGVMSNEHVQAAAAAVGREIVTNKQTNNRTNERV